MKVSLHITARTGKLHLIRKELLTAENLLAPDHRGYTPLHAAAFSGELNLIPLDVLTKENLLLEDRCRKTPMHVAAIAGKLYQIPRYHLTLETLLCGNPEIGRRALWGPDKIPTPLHEAVTNNHIDQLLGIDFGDNKLVKIIVGQGWWDKNKHVLSAKKGTTTNESNADIALF